MEHEDKPAPVTPPEGAGRTRVANAAPSSSRSTGPTDVPGGSAPADEGEGAAGDSSAERGSRPPKGAGTHPNNVRRLRIERMMSKAELARRANVSVLTIDRVEKGFGCRMDTKRKILEALGLTLTDRVRVFGEEE